MVIRPCNEMTLGGITFAVQPQIQIIGNLLLLPRIWRKSSTCVHIAGSEMRSFLLRKQKHNQQQQQNATTYKNLKLILFSCDM